MPCHIGKVPLFSQCFPFFLFFFYCSRALQGRENRRARHFLGCPAHGGRKSVPCAADGAGGRELWRKAGARGRVALPFTSTVLPVTIRWRHLCDVCTSFEREERSAPTTVAICRRNRVKMRLKIPAPSLRSEEPRSTRRWRRRRQPHDHETTLRRLQRCPKMRKAEARKGHGAARSTAAPSRLSHVSSLFQNGVSVYTWCFVR